MEADTLDKANKLQAKISQKEKILKTLAEANTLRVICCFPLKPAEEISLGEATISNVKDLIMKALTKQISSLEADFKSL